MTKGKLYGVGVGPGDPELLTLKAVKILQNADVIAVPNTGTSEKAAYAICEEYIKDKLQLECIMPMTRDKQRLEECYEKVADDIIKFLDDGKDVACITLGDPSVYSTYVYVHKKVLDRGYEAQLIPGVTSFCAVAAKLNISLCEGAEPLLIIPASYENTDKCLAFEGNKVLMKAGKSINAVCDKLSELGKLESSAMVECCGMENERVFQTLKEFDGNSSYFSVIVVKEEK